MLTKMIFFSKIKKLPSVWPKGNNNQNLKDIRAVGSEIIATRTDGRRTKSHIINLADSQPEPKRLCLCCQ